MSSNNAVRSAVRHALYVGALATVLGYNPAAVAQQDDEELEEITVTGTQRHLLRVRITGCGHGRLTCSLFEFSLIRSGSQATRYVTACQSGKADIAPGNVRLDVCANPPSAQSLLLLLSTENTLNGNYPCSAIDRNSSQGLI